MFVCLYVCIYVYVYVCIYTSPFIAQHDFLRDLIPSYYSIYIHIHTLKSYIHTYVSKH